MTNKPRIIWDRPCYDATPRHRWQQFNCSCGQSVVDVVPEYFQGTKWVTCPSCHNRINRLFISDEGMPDDKGRAGRST